VLVGGLAVANVARSTVVPKRYHLAWNLAMGAGAVAVARAAGLGAPELGLARRSARDGLRVGGIAFAAITTAVASAVSAAAVAGQLDDDRADVDAAEAALRALLIIPIGTVLVEELAFRGALHGLLERVPWASVGATYAVGSVLFGLWHVAPIWSDGAAVVVGTVVATTAAGAGFIWLRRSSDSVLAPMLAHVATNSSTFLLAWWASQG
jgi:membrane protease YdiL (CAAX protease family)